MQGRGGACRGQILYGYPAILKQACLSGDGALQVPDCWTEKHNSLLALMRHDAWMSAVISNMKHKIKHGTKKDGQESTVLKNLFQMLVPVAAEKVLGSIAKHAIDVVLRPPRHNEMMRAWKEEFKVDRYGRDLKAIPNNS